jgi:hypothetical protein
MTFKSCPREREVSQLLSQGAWPQACPPALRAHVESCRSCADLALITSTFQQARSQAASAAPLASPGALWWRAQLRRRNAAVERVGKPILGAQIFALAINLFILVALLASQARNGLAWLTRIEQLPQSSAWNVEKLWPSALLNPGWSVAVVVPVVATLALLCAVVVYLAVAPPPAKQ